MCGTLVCCVERARPVTEQEDGLNIDTGSYTLRCEGIRKPEQLLAHFHEYTKKTQKQFIL